jgi:hypothetical protein
MTLHLPAANGCELLARWIHREEGNEWAWVNLL